MTRPSLLRSTLSFTGGTFVSRILGLVREIVFARVFGVDAATDAFWVAFRIPNFMRRLFAEGSFSTAFVPALTEMKEHGSPQDLRLMIARVSGTLGAVLLLIVALGMLFSPQIAGLFAPGTEHGPAKLQLTSELLRITFPFLLFISLTAMAGGVLNTFHRFAIPAITPVIMNLCMIAAALWWAPYFRVPVTAMAWAILISGVLQLLVQLPALAKLGLLSWPRWGWGAPEVRKVMRLMLPTLFGSSVAQVNLLFDTFIAAYLITGSQSWLTQSDRLLEFPLGMFGVALGTVILPTLSRHFVQTDDRGFSRALDWGLRTTLLISVPAMLALVLLAQPLLATMFQYGKFTPHDTHMAALSLSALSFGLPAFALVKVLAPAFFARQDTKTPVRAGVASLLANMVLNALFLALLFWLWHSPGDLANGWVDGLSRVPGLHMALALASALASYLNLTLLWRALRQRGIYQREPGWPRFVVRLVVACTVMGALLVAGLALWPDWNVGKWMRIGHLLALVAGGGLAYVLALVAMGFRVSDLRGD
ncbi:MAG: murein biosynthesis integral membrane protein MurJ [Arenimonas sp.]